MAHFDVVIVGASIAGSTAAILLGRAGLRVALVERHGRLDAYKTLCTHHVMACATPTIHRLGLDTRIEAAGGVRNGLNLYTPWGWVVTPPDMLHGYSIRREILDPMLRRTAAETCGVDLRLGQKVVALLAEQAGVRVRDAHGAEHDIHAPGRRGGRGSLLSRRPGRRYDAGRTEQPIHVLRGVHRGAAPQHRADRAVDA